MMFATEAVAAAAPLVPPHAEKLPLLDAVLYGLVQGVTEFLPVSSSTHLTLLGRGLAAWGRKPIDPAYVMLFHLPTLLAVVWILRKELMALATTQRRLLWPLGFATVVTGALGSFLDKRFGQGADSLFFLGTNLCLSGLILVLVERVKPKASEGAWTWDRGLAVGLGQSLSGIPGFSRMGMSTCAGMLTRRSALHAVVFSFLCSIPVVVGKTGKEFWKCAQTGESGFWTTRVLYGAYPVGALIAFGTGVLTFRWLLKRLQTRTLVPFGIYCAILGALTLTLSHGADKMPRLDPAGAPNARPADGSEGHEPKKGTPGVDGGGGDAAPADQPDLVHPEGRPEPPLPPR